MVDQLAAEFADQPVLFLEQNIDSPIGDRRSRWEASYSGDWRYTYLPWVMADSGNRLSSGPVAFANVYRGIVQAEMARPPQAAIEAYARRVGDSVRVYARFTNQSQATLMDASNGATIHAITWEDAHVGVTGREVRAAPFARVTSPVAPQGVAAFTLDSPALSGVNWDNLHTVVVVDYRPGGQTGPYDMLQAALATPPAITADPAALTFQVSTSDPSSGTAQVALRGPPVVSWTSSSDVLWLQLAPSSGVLPAQLELTVRPELLPGGTQEGHVTFTGSSPDGLALTTTVTVQAQRTDQPRPVRRLLHRAH